MKAIFDFIPAYCPNCGKRLFDPGRAEYLTTLGATLEDYHAGQPFTCDCGLAFEKAQAAPVIYSPFGWLAGKAWPLLDVLQNLSTEILGHAADLEERQETAAQAGPLRRYGWALWLIGWQLLTQEQKARAKVDRAALAELAKEYNLVLPGDLTAGEEAQP